MVGATLLALPLLLDLSGISTNLRLKRRRVLRAKVVERKKHHRVSKQKRHEPTDSSGCLNELIKTALAAYAVIVGLLVYRTILDSAKHDLDILIEGFQFWGAEVVGAWLYIIAYLFTFLISVFAPLLVLLVALLVALLVCGVLLACFGLPYLQVIRITQWIVESINKNQLEKPIAASGLLLMILGFSIQIYSNIVL